MFDILFLLALLFIPVYALADMHDVSKMICHTIQSVQIPPLQNHKVLEGTVIMKVQTQNQVSVAIS